MSILIDRFSDHAFEIFMNDHSDTSKEFEAIFIFPHKKYFPRIAFGLIYLLGSKTYVFIENLELLGFQSNV